MIKYIILLSILAFGAQCEHNFDAMIAEYQSNQFSDIDLCYGMPNNHFVKNSRGCAWFNHCWNDTSTPNRCPEGYWFREPTQMCDYPENTECNLDENEMLVCPERGFHIIAHPYSCQHFTICFDGLQQDRTCEPGLHFSYYDRKCVDPFFADCNLDRNLCGESGTPAEPKFVPNTRDCESYFLCVGTDSIPLRCRPGLQFDPENNWCDEPEVVNCTSTLPGDQPSIPDQITMDCESDENLLIFFPHPESCDFYFGCVGGSSHLRFCAPGLIFDILTERCNFPELSQCILDLVDEDGPNADQLIHVF